MAVKNLPLKFTLSLGVKEPKKFGTLPTHHALGAEAPERKLTLGV